MGPQGWWTDSFAPSNDSSEKIQRQMRERDGMAFGAGSGRGRLVRFALASAWRRTRYAFHASALYRWKYYGQVPERLLIAPTDLRTADPTIANDIYAGRFVFAGEVVDVAG